MFWYGMLLQTEHSATIRGDKGVGGGSEMAKDKNKHTNGHKKKVIRVQQQSQADCSAQSSMFQVKEIIGNMYFVGSLVIGKRTGSLGVNYGHSMYPMEFLWHMYGQTCVKVPQNF